MVACSSRWWGTRVVCSVSPPLHANFLETSTPSFFGKVNLNLHLKFLGKGNLHPKVFVRVKNRPRPICLDSKPKPVRPKFVFGKGKPLRPSFWEEETFKPLVFLEMRPLSVERRLPPSFRRESDKSPHARFDPFRYVLRIRWLRGPERLTSLDLQKETKNIRKKWIASCSIRHTNQTERYEYAKSACPDCCNARGCTTHSQCGETRAAAHSLTLTLLEEKSNPTRHSLLSVHCLVQHKT